MTTEARGYGLKGRDPTGRAIVEGRDGSYKLTVWAQDLRPQTLYNIYLLFASSKGHPGICMGSLPVDERGRADVRKDFDDDKLGENQLTDIVGVVVTVKNIGGVTSPLCGYREGIVSWRHGFYEYKKVTPPVATQEKPDPPVAIIPNIAEDTPQNEPTEDEISHDTQEEANSEAETPPDDEHIDSGAKTVEEPIQSEPEAPVEDPAEPSEPTPQDNFTITPPEPERESEAQPPLTASNTQPTNWVDTLPSGEMASAFRTALDKLQAETAANTDTCTQESNLHELFETREPITPFQKQTRITKWIRFTLSDPVPPPTNKPELYNDPFIQGALSEHGHLLLGKTIDQGPRRYIIGVPGTYDQSAKQKAKRLGFTQFKCNNDARPAWGEAGYWLIFTTVC